MEIKDKIIIKEKSSVECPMANLKGTLRWNHSVDLDLWCLIKTKNGRTEQIGFNNLGSLQSFPHIKLDEDNLGKTTGAKEENIHFKSLEHLDHAFICANIYGKRGDSFSKYDGSVTISSSSKELVIPLTNKETGTWCAVAHLDNTGEKPQLINLNKVFQNRPKIADLISGEHPTEKKGLLSRMFGS